MLYLDMSIRNLWRHKIRSGLTVLGIVLAIAAIVSLGSISEGIDTLVKEQLKMAAGFVTVSEASSGSTYGPPSLDPQLDMSIVSDIEDIEGVEKVSPVVRMMIPELNTIVIGIDIEDKGISQLGNIDIKIGDWPDNDANELVLGYIAAETLNLDVSDSINIRETEFEITGILEELKSFTDYAVIAPFNPLSDAMGLDDKTSSLIVEPEDIGEASRIADEINELSDDIEALAPEDAVERAANAVNEIRVMTLGIGIVASIVASIGIINTMIMVVLERIKEFGIMKALGAEKKVILFMVLGEGMILAIIGGIIGILIGVAGTAVINSYSGYAIAIVTPSLAIISFIYGIILSVVASVYPAYSAINVDPVEAMREE
jgi:putative ABC transport system permease protein